MLWWAFTAPFLVMDEEDTLQLLEDARCFAECLATGQLDYVETYLINEWANQ